jgi:hypothetical protein
VVAFWVGAFRGLGKKLIDNKRGKVEIHRPR